MATEEIVAAAQEERFTRKKHDFSFPEQAIDFCLKKAGIKAPQLDCVAFYEKPFLKFERLLETYIALAPAGFRSFQMAMPLWLKEKLFQKKLLRDEFKQFGDIANAGDRLLFCEHGLAPDPEVQRAYFEKFKGQINGEKWAEIQHTVGASAAARSSSKGSSAASISRSFWRVHCSATRTAIVS